MMGLIKGPTHVDFLRAEPTGYSQQSHNMAVLIVNKISSESYILDLVYRIDKHLSELLCADLTRLTQSNHCKKPSTGFHRRLKQINMWLDRA